MYIFSKLESIKKELSQRGVEVIDLSIGDPDQRVPDFIINEFVESVRNNNYGYPPYRGIDDFKKAVAMYYHKKYNVVLDYENEVAALIGSKEGIAHLILGIMDIEDYIIIPDPAYPVYNASAIISGCNIYKMDLNEKNNFLPELELIDKDVLSKAKALVVNYPNNPTGAVANKDFYDKLISFGKQNNIVIINDGAYMDIYSGADSMPSLLQADGAMDIAVEFGSLSKSYNMTGWRLGYIVGNREVINQLMLIKTNFDSGQFSSIQDAGTIALVEGQHVIERLNKVYDERRKLLLGSLNTLGIKAFNSTGTFYIWFKNPAGFTSEEFVSKLLVEAGVLITPGSAFGKNGEGYCRISLTAEENKILEAAKRLSGLSI